MPLLRILELQVVINVGYERVREVLFTEVGEISG